MNRGFWDKLQKPIFALAPMANVTDFSFRSIIAKNGKPHVMWTEFVSVEGLLSAGRQKLLVDLKFSDDQRPIVAQIFGNKPEHFAEVAKLLAAMGFDGIDINMGCPDKAVVKQGAGGASIKNPKLAQEIIAAAKEGAGTLPVSVKTRIGFGRIEIDSWIPQLLLAEPAALTVHLRTVKEMSKVPAHWELMPEIVKILSSVNRESKPILLGNGDVMTLDEAEEKVKKTGCDGIMFGRAIFGNPWLFSGRPQPAVSERMRAMLEHTRLFEKEFLGIKNFEVMKKHYKAYVNGFGGAKELRIKLMEARDYPDVEHVIFEQFPVLKDI